MNIKYTKLYLVGGCVRDMILKRQAKDRDYVAITNLSFEELVEEINKIGRVFQAKPEFMTIRCSIDNEVIDIALPRKESGYDDNRHPTDVERVDTLKEDAGRRDFTMNSIYWNEEEGFIDNFKGREAIASKYIETVGQPRKRFEEDYLRILRAIRFSCQLKFDIEGFTYSTMKGMSHKISEVEPNRVREELNKSLLADAQKTAFYLENLNLWSILKDMGLSFQVTSKEVKKSGDKV